ncbi:MAG: hypothetical protein A2169_13060 [Deltaproteobacteria bacterium RBG_13_47_9]|nr:MAG: hypothetical protein A2169_13060 [Deltaproteobacteria bacterium RBG_13_47_9]
MSISFGEEGIGHNKKILLDGRFQSFRVSDGTAEGFPERRGGRSLLRRETNPDLQKVVFPFHNGIK